MRSRGSAHPSGGASVVGYRFRLAGAQVVQSHYNGDTFSAGNYSALPLLDVTATLSAGGKQLVVFAINRSEQAAVDCAITLALGQFAGPVQVHCVNGADIKARNTFDNPQAVMTTVREQAASGREVAVTFEPHSVTALVCSLA